MIGKLFYYVSRALNRRPASKYHARIDKKAVVGNGAQIVDSSIGRYSYVHNTSVVCTDVGAFCSIAQDCTIGGGAHPTDWVSSSPVFYKGKNVFRKHFSDHAFEEYRRTTIGNDVWIGSKCLIKAGVTIGDGAVIGMGSVVTHDVPPYEIWGGNPARCIRKRFDDEVIEGLLASRWWDFPEEKLARFAPYYNDPVAFLEAIRADKETENG